MRLLSLLFLFAFVVGCAGPYKRPCPDAPRVMCTYKSLPSEAPSRPRMDPAAAFWLLQGMQQREQARRSLAPLPVQPVPSPTPSPRLRTLCIHGEHITTCY